MRWIDAARRNRDRGALSVEWVGIVALILIVVGSVILATARIDVPIATTVSSWIQCMAPGQACGTDGAADVDQPGVETPGDGPRVTIDPPDISDLPGIPDPPGVGPGDGQAGGPQIPEIPSIDGPRGDHEVGDPVNTLSGAFVASVSDVTPPAGGSVGLPFMFLRTYDSTRTDQGVLGQGWRHAYEMRVDTLSDGGAVLTTEAGERIEFGEGDNGSFAAPDGVYSTLEQDEQGFRLTRKDGDVLEFAADGRLLAMSDRFGYVTELEYEEDQLRRIQDGGGGDHALVYENDRLQEVVLDDGRSVEFSYEGGLLTEVTTLDGFRTTFDYDDRGLLTETHDAEGHRTVTNTYDDDGRVTHQIDAAGGEWTFDYGDDGVTVFTDPHGNTWSHLYRNNLLVAQADPRGNTTTFQYDENSELVGLTDPRGHTSNLRRDATGNVTAVEGPEGTQFSWRMEYDDQHNLTRVVNPSNHEVAFEYDGTGALASVVDAEGNETRISYDDDLPGVPAEIQDPLGNRTRLVHDDAGQLQRTEAADGSVVSFSYDPRGNVVEVIGALGLAQDDPDIDRTVMSYDEMGRLTELTDAIGRTTGLTYDGVGNLVSVEDADREEHHLTYDARGLLTEVHDSLGRVASFAYDLIGNVTQVTDAAGVSQSITYDEAARPTSLTDGVGNQYRYRHDANGNIVEALSVPAGADEPDPDATVVITYDALDQPVTIDYADGTPPTAIEYTPVGQIREIASGYARERYTWTPNGQLDIYDQDGRFFAHEYDANGNLISQEQPDGSEVVMAYDEANRPVEVSGPEREMALDYDPAGRLAEAVETVGDDLGLTHEFVYDTVGQLLESTTRGPDGLVASQEISYDNSGQPLEVDALNELYEYEYDARGALLAATRSEAGTGALLDEFLYSYDDAGRRVAEEHDGSEREYHYDDGGRVDTIAGPDETLTLSYDMHGNVTEAGDRSYEYDPNGRLASATTPEGQVQYERDVLGRVITSTTRVNNDEQNGTGVVEQHGSTWSPSSLDTSPTLVDDPSVDDTVRISGGMQTQLADDSTHRLLPDHLGSTGAAVDESGSAAASFAYGPFGSVTEASGGDVDRVMSQFGGQVPDTLTGALQFAGQTYDPDAGIFLQSAGDSAQVPNSPIELTSQSPAANASSGEADAEAEAAAAPAAAPIIAIPAIGALFKAIGVGAIIGGVVSVLSQLVVGEFSIKTLIVDVIFGGLTAGIGKFVNVTKLLHNFGIFALIGSVMEGIKQFILDGTVNIVDSVLSGIFDGALRAISSGIEAIIPENINKILQETFEGLGDALPKLTDLGGIIVSRILKEPVVDGIRSIGCGIASVWGGCGSGDRPSLPDIGPGIPVPHLK